MVLLVAGILALVSAWWVMIWNRIPSSIKLRADTAETLNFQVPASGDIYMEDVDVNDDVNRSLQGEAVPVSGFDNNLETKDSIHVNLSGPVTFKTGSINNYTVDLRLFGLIPLKSVQIEVIEDKKVIPAGIPIGIYVKTKGVLVVGIGDFEGEDGYQRSPAQYILQPGDYILAINDIEVTGKSHLIELVSHCEGQNMIMKVQRGAEVIELMVKPEANFTGDYKLGAWVRDNAQGVGTMTYIEADGRFGALGHGINDVDISELMTLESGALYYTEIINIKRGSNGSPGELTGFIEYEDKNRLGSITENTPYGIFGVCNEVRQESIVHEPVSIGLKQDIERGPAQIICSITGEAQLYDVEITQINLDSANVNRGIVLKITDPELLSLTGGIVQGMSGSPIIQGEKLIGAVTHVLVQDATSGYGIFIESMIGH
jgi:stage IV sporulation protein B